MMKPALPRTFLPLALAVRGHPCVVVGGGAVAGRKVATLLDFGGEVTVVSPELTEELRRAAEGGRVHWIPERFRAEHLDGARLAVAATDDGAANAAVAAAAGARGILVCDASAAERSDFTFGALLEGADERIAVFTDGRSPRHARETRDRLRQELGGDALVMGRLTAGATHELRNVLAIVKESAGLVADLARMRDRNVDPDGERTHAAVARIDAQVARGAELLTALNRLAHGPERGAGTLDLGEHLHEAAVLCRRFAAQRRCALAVEAPGRELPVRGRVVPLVACVAAVVDALLQGAPEGSTLRLRAELAEGAPCLTAAIEPPEGSAPGAPDTARVVPWARALAARITVTEAGTLALAFLPGSDAGAGPEGGVHE